MASTPVRLYSPGYTFDPKTLESHTVTSYQRYDIIIENYNIHRDFGNYRRVLIIDKAGLVLFDIAQTDICMTQPFTKGSTDYMIVCWHQLLQAVIDITNRQIISIENPDEFCWDHMSIGPLNQTLLVGGSINICRNEIRFYDIDSLIQGRNAYLHESVEQDLRLGIYGEDLLTDDPFEQLISNPKRTTLSWRVVSEFEEITVGEHRLYFPEIDLYYNHRSARNHARAVGLLGRGVAIMDEHADMIAYYRTFSHEFVDYQKITLRRTDDSVVQVGRWLSAEARLPTWCS